MDTTNKRPWWWLPETKSARMIREAQERYETSHQQVEEKLNGADTTQRIQRAVTRNGGGGMKPC